MLVGKSKGHVRKTHAPPRSRGSPRTTTFRYRRDLIRLELTPKEAKESASIDQQGIIQNGGIEP